MLSTKCENALCCVLLRHLTNSTRKPTHSQTLRSLQSPCANLRRKKTCPWHQKKIDLPPPQKKTSTMCLRIWLLRLWICRQLRNVENLSNDTASHPRKTESSEHVPLSFNLHQLPSPAYSAFQFWNHESVSYGRTRRTPQRPYAAKFPRILYAKCNKRNQKKVGLEGERIAMKLPCGQSQSA